ncbi:MAG: hypothetical protein LW821_02355 [Flammeovirgaceae bacterium]|jgi:hypothetical protein|nr:hypothetical protein [Flammeovirgaceae bacterium]
MDRIQQAFDNLKERFSNPFILSFLFSWVYWNWEITISLIWYDSTNDYQGLIEFVGSHINRDYSLLFPLYSALVYTIFVSPMLKLKIRFIQNLVFKAGESLDIRMLKNGKVSLNKYLSLKEEYQKRTETLEMLIANEEEKINELERNKSQLLQARHDLSETKAKLNSIESSVHKIHDVGIINGKWTKISKFPGEDNSVIKIEIMNNNVYIKDVLPSEHKYSIRDFFYNDSNKSLTFTFFSLESNSLHSVYQLTLAKKDMNGREYIGTKEYTVIFDRDDI